MKRRDALKLGASVAAFPAIIPKAWAAQAGRADWKPSLLDDHQNETVVVLSDLIIPATDTPGAKAANVNRYVDLFIRDGGRMQREAFVEGLAWLDANAIREYGHPFVRCTSTQQVGMLTALDEGEGPGHDFFRRAKSLISRIYYSTEIGYRELNKGGRVPSTFGCRHGSHA
jgi:hypothetical protein